MINPLYLPELREMLAEGDADGLREFCTALHPARTAEFMDGLEANEAWAVLQHADESTRVEIFGYIDEETQLEIAGLGERGDIGRLIAEMPADDRVDLINELAEPLVDELLPHVPEEERRDIRRLQSYAEETAGAVMTSEIAKLPEEMTVRPALEEIGRQAEELETIYYIYIVDDEDHLRGVVSARQLVSHLGRPETTVRELMERDVVTVDVDDDQEAVAEKVARYDLLAIPVVDAEHRLLGIVTHDDVIDVMREEATEDAHRLSAVAPLEEGYLETGLLTLTRKRALWLMILFGFALLTALALRGYESDLARLSWLLLFIPLVISSGGNSGSQSATLVITALTRRDIELSDWWRIARREVVMGLLLGGVLGLVGFLFAIPWAGSAQAATVIPVTVLLVVLCGTLLGALLPLLFSRLGLDPALMSNPFVAGIIDVVGIVIYMQVALAILGRAAG